MHFIKCENPNILKQHITNIIDQFYLIIYEDEVFTTDSIVHFLKSFFLYLSFFSVGPNNLHEGADLS